MEASAIATPQPARQALARTLGEVIYRFKDGIFRGDFLRRNAVIGIPLRDVIGIDNMMRGSDYPHSESTFPQSRKILAEILAGVPDDEQAKPAPVPDPGIAGGNTRVYNFDVARLTVPANPFLPS